MPPVIPSVYIKETSWGLTIRIVLSTGLCLWIAGVATAVGGTFWLVLISFWLPAVALALVIHRARLTTTGDVLTYRGPLQTRTWRREDIAAFWLSKRLRRATAHIEMETMTGEQVVFWAISASLLAERDELDRWEATLQNWLEATEEPSLG